MNSAGVFASNYVMNHTIKTGFLALTLAFVGLALTAGSADAQRPSPRPVLSLMPVFKCGVSVTAANVAAIVTKADSNAIDKTKDISVTMQTPSGLVTATVCGSAFASNAAGTQTSMTFAPATDSSWIYTCVAHQATSSVACNPVK